jgi:hypothetical protein
VSAAIARVGDAPPPGWSDLLLEDRNATAAHRPELWTVLSQIHPGWSLRFLAVERDGALLGGAPLFLDRRLGHTWIHAMPYVLPGTPLARPGCHAEVDAASGVAMGALQREVRAVGGEWSLYRPAGPDPGDATFASTSGETRRLETSNIDLEEGLAAAWRRVDRDTRHELRRARARGLRVAEEPEALEPTYALHLAQARAWPRYRPLPLEVSRRLLGAPSAGFLPPVARLVTVRDRRGLVAGMFFLDHVHEILGWWSGMRGGPRAQHAMPFLVWSVVEWAAEAGRRRLNLGGSIGRASLAAFKHALGARACSYPVRWLDAGHGPWTARLLAGLQRGVRRGRFQGEPA